MTYQGVLKKMMTENSDQIQYYLDMNDDFINMNQLLNTTITIDFVTYECLHCHLEKEIIGKVSVNLVFLILQMQEIGSCDLN